MLEEYRMNLFSVDPKYALAHCISQDCAMGAGIAAQFNQRFPEMKKELLARKRQVGESQHYFGLEHDQNGAPVGNRHVFNLITKRRYWEKPTYESLEAALLSMKEQMAAQGIANLAIPQIGCGLDRLNWERVSRMVDEMFQGTGVNVLVCVWK